MLHLTCIKELSQTRRVFQSIMNFEIQVGDQVILNKADNLSDSENLYWLISINHDDSYGEDDYGYLIQFDSKDDFEKYFE